MKFTPIFTIGIASLAAASPLFNVVSSEEKRLDRRDHSKEGAQKANDHAQKQQQTEQSHRDKQNAHKSKQEEHKKHHTATAVAPVPAPAPSFPPHYLNTSSVLTTSSTTPLIPTSIASTSSSSATAVLPPTPSSPESIVSSVASDILGLINGIFGDVLGIASSIGQDISSIFGDSNGSDGPEQSGDLGFSDGFGFSFGFSKRTAQLTNDRQADTSLEARDSSVDEIEAALGTLVTNVLGHLVSLANGTNVSLSLSFSAALDL